MALSICWDCAKSEGAHVPQGHSPTWWVGKCDLCDTVKEVTADRDYSPRKLLIDAHQWKIHAAKINALAYSRPKTKHP